MCQYLRRYKQSRPTVALVFWQTLNIYYCDCNIQQQIKNTVSGKGLNSLDAFFLAK